MGGIYYVLVPIKRKVYKYKGGNNTWQWCDFCSISVHTRFRRSTLSQKSSGNVCHSSCIKFTLGIILVLDGYPVFTANHNTSRSEEACHALTWLESAINDTVPYYAAVYSLYLRCAV